MVVAFIGIDGSLTQAKLQHLAEIVFRLLQQYDGILEGSRIDFGDKGCNLLLFWGGHRSYENNVARAFNFLLDLRNQFPSGQWRAGVTQQMMYFGYAGGSRQGEFTCYGRGINMAARMMMKGDWNDILTPEALTKTSGFEFTHKGDFSYKGFATPIPTYRLVCKTSAKLTLFSDRMIGRQRELQQLVAMANALFFPPIKTSIFNPSQPNQEDRDRQKFLGIASIYGEAGMGKSHLLHEFQKALEHSPITWLEGHTDQILKKPFNPFVDMLNTRFGLHLTAVHEEKMHRFEKAYDRLIKGCQDSQSSFVVGETQQTNAAGNISPEEIIQELVRVRSLIGALVGLHWNDSLYERLDAKARYENTLFALKTWLYAESLLNPVVLLIEDGHWLDEDSQNALKTICRNIQPYPILILSTMRYTDDGRKPTLIIPHEADMQNISTIEIDLNALSPEDIRTCAEAEIGHTIAEAVLDLLIEKTHGNPFFVQQLANYLRENGFIVLHSLTPLQDKENKIWCLQKTTTELPNALHSIMIARIDRLVMEVKEIVKVASVIGRMFEVHLLSAVLTRQIDAQLKQAETEHIWNSLNELQYLFKHALLRDAAYDMQLRSHLRKLHGLTAEVMENLYANDLASKYADIAFHYEKAEVIDKTIVYLEKAGDDAKENYQNHQAISFYDRLIQHLEHRPDLLGLHVDILLKKGDILKWTSDWQHALEVNQHALAKAERLNDPLRMGRCFLNISSVYRYLGEYERAKGHLEKALSLFDALGDLKHRAKVFMNLGWVYQSTSEYSQALEYLRQGLQIGETLDDKALLYDAYSNMGTVYFETGDHDQACVCFEKDFELAQAMGNKQLISEAFGNLGMVYATKGDDFEGKVLRAKINFSIACHQNDLQAQQAVVTELENLLKRSESESERATLRDELSHMYQALS